MKHSLCSSSGRFALVVFLASVLGLAVSEQRASAQQGQGVYVTQASARLTKLINSANKAKYKLSDNSFSIGGGWLKQSKTAWVPLFTVELKAGREYRFLAAGDNDARDVDLDIRDPDGTTVAVDDKTDPEAVVNYRPTNSGIYTVRLRLYESQDNLPCVCLAIMMVK
jgi:hypothetical protein